jgi:4-amino-4-deoxy-L-arabinose transferase-like glycosyltransferase
MSRPERRLVSLGIGLAACLLMLVDLGARIFGTNDEARFPLLAQAVLERGEWFFPRINGVVYHTKPLLLAWLIAGASAPLGHVTQLTAALPSAVAAVATVLLVRSLARAMFGAVAGRCAALAAMTTSGLFFHGRLAMPDMLLACFMTASVAAFWFMTRERGEPARPGHWLAFYGFAVAGFWTKGVPGLLPLVLAPVCGLLAGRGIPWRRLHLAAGLPLVVALVAPWWILHLGSDRGEMRSLVLYDQLFWYLPHRLSLATAAAPLRNVASILFPWTLLVPAVAIHVVRALRRRDATRDDLAFVTAWTLLVLVVAAASQEQRLRYWVPLVPPVALLVGHWCATARSRVPTRPRVPAVAYAGLAVVALAILVLALHALGASSRAELALPSSLGETLVLAAGLTAMIAALAHGAWRDRRGRAMTGAAVGAAVLLVAGYHGQLARHNRAYDYPRLYETLEARAPGARLVAAWDVYEMPLTFYARQSVSAVQSAPALRAALGESGHATAVVSDQRMGDVPGIAVLLRDRVALRPVSVVTTAHRDRDR